MESYVARFSHFLCLFAFYSPEVGNLLHMRCFVGTFAAALGFVAAVGAFHTPYRPEQSRHYDVTKTDSFHPITEKVFVHLPPLSARAYLGRCNYLAGYPFYCWCN